MLRTLITLGVIAGLSGCIVAPPYAYTAAPPYYAAPVVSVGVGGGYWRVR